ncbi:TIGR04104 family putative zinc finger protein [Virgibacillus sp. W0181]|uniref:TIGR04104 family putative zinc finger protein n=1 Tax=Virgibacillus sp. W0181 TaxID=3391581 RepID=UPI003F47D1C4
MLPTCQHCHTPWTYTDTLKNMLQLRCPYCQQKNYLSKKVRMRDALFSLLPIPIMILFNVSFPWILGLGANIILVLALIYPYIIQLSKHEDPLW